MTGLAYMMYSDWANNGNGTTETSAQIRAWIGDTSAYVFCAEKAEYLEADTRKRGIARDLLEAIRSPEAKTIATTYGELSQLEGQRFDAVLIATIPHGERETESLLRAIRAGTFTKLLVISLHDGEFVNHLFDAFAAVDVASGERHELPDSLRAEAARMMVNEEYNGLGSGNGKDTVLTLIHAFREAGYPVDKRAWLGAYFAAGGKARHAETVAKYIDEIGKGIKHRYRNRYRSNIVEILQERMDENLSEESPAG
ncbi:MAG: hypothetical protein WDA07_15180 [Leucobacter sp.]